MGVYAESEFKDMEGVLYKVEIIDTTFNASITEFKGEEEGFVQTWDGFQDDLWFSPINNSSVMVPIYVTDSDNAINAFIDELQNASEDQYYIRIYRAGTMIWLGKVLVDLVEKEYTANSRFELNATDGLNRLDKFRCDFHDNIQGDWITLLDLVLNCVAPCKFDQFFAPATPYISCTVTWKENSQTSTNGFLKNTRIPKLLLIEDLEKGTKKSCKQALIDALGAFGCCIRFDRGRWFVTQPSNFTSTNALAYNYKKNGAFIGTESILVQSDVDGDPNYTLTTIMDSYKPNYKEVAISCIDFGYSKFEKTSFNKSGFEHTLFVANKLNAYNLKYTVQYAYFVAGSLGKDGKAVTFQTTFSITSGEYQLRIINGTFRWFKGLPREVGGNTGGNNPVRVDDSVTVFGPEPFTIQGNITIPALPADAPDSMHLSIWVAADGSSRLWTGLFTIKQDGTSEIQYSTQNTDANAASISVDNEIMLSDFANDFSSSPVQIYTGTTWQYSEQWTDDGSGINAVPMLRLLAENAMYFQRSPRLLVQGEINLTDADSLDKLNYRGGSYLFLNGTFTASSCIWEGVWMELLRQTTSVATVSNNPYRNLFSQMHADIGTIKSEISDLNTKLNGVGEVSTLNADEISRMKKILQRGPDGWLIQNLDGIPNGAADDAVYSLVAQVSSDGNKTIKLKFTP